MKADVVASKQTLQKTIFTTGDIAKICKVCPRTVSKWHDSGKLLGYRIPGSQDRRIPRANLLAFLRDHGMPTDELELASATGVLTITPDTALALRLAELLLGKGWRHVQAVSGFDAGVLLGTFRPDVVVIDFGLGRSEGLHILQRLRQCKNQESEGAPTIVLASEDEPTIGSLVDVHGATEAIRKPFDLALLSEIVRRLVGVE